MAASQDQSPRTLRELQGNVLGGRYELGSVLGIGGMGAVFKAQDLRLGRAVAIKVMRPVFAGHDEYIKRFLREAQTASTVRHRNVVVVLDYGEAAGGLIYSVMEFLVGQDLEELLKRQPGQRMPWREACGVLMQIANGLRAAHGQGVIHRDIKPANCFLTEEDDELVVKLVDFGIAKREDPGHSQLTATGGVLGTPSYIAPELVRTQCPASPRSDVYSLGVVAYRMLTGRLPFTGETAFEVMRRACMDPVPSMREWVFDLPPEVDRLVGEMLAKEPADRLADMAVVRQRLQALARELPGGQAVEIPMSSAQVLDGGAPTPPMMTERTTMPHELPGAGVGRLQPPEAITPFQLEPVPTPRPLHDPNAAPWRPGETLPSMGEATLRTGDSTSTERSLRRLAAWLAAGAVVVGAAVGGVASMSGDATESTQNEVRVDAEHGGAAGAVEPVVAEPIAVASTPEPHEPILQPSAIEPTATETTATENTVEQPEAPTVEDPKPKASNRSSGPPSDGTLKKRLAKRIKSNCTTVMGSQRVTVSFLVTKSGGISMLTATPKNAAGDCAKRQVEGTRFRRRGGEETAIKIVVE